MAAVCITVEQNAKCEQELKPVYHFQRPDLLSGSQAPFLTAAKAPEIAIKGEQTFNYQPCRDISYASHKKII